MQQPPIDLRMPATGHVDRGPNTGLQWLIVITVLVTAVALVTLLTVQKKGRDDAHEQYVACVLETPMMQQATDAPCIEEDGVPAYAAHPIGYAAIVGLAVFVIGRVGLFMVRMERARGY